MNCWHCKTELIWGADHDIEDDETYGMVTNLSCPKCKCHVDVYRPKEEDEGTGFVVHFYFVYHLIQ